jgi:uncharacterized membrane protein YeaQ/YmgE (transglycosylase-associated protein family)
MLTVIILAALWGLIVGALARFALPGPDPMPWWQTILLGLAGSFVGGIVGRLLFGGRGGGIILSVVGAVILLALHRKYVQKRPVFRA